MLYWCDSSHASVRLICALVSDQIWRFVGLALLIRSVTARSCGLSPQGLGIALEPSIDWLYPISPKSSAASSNLPAISGYSLRKFSTTIFW